MTKTDSERIDFSEAGTQQEFCNLTQLDFKSPGRNETFQTAFYSQCMKNDHPNVLICPAQSSVLSSPDPEVARNVKLLEEKLKEIKKRTKKQKTRKRKHCKRGKTCSKKVKRRKMKTRKLNSGIGKKRRKRKKGRKM